MSGEYDADGEVRSGTCRGWSPATTTMLVLCLGYVVGVGCYNFKLGPVSRTSWAEPCYTTGLFFFWVMMLMEAYYNYRLGLLYGKCHGCRPPATTTS